LTNIYTKHPARIDSRAAKEWSDYEQPPWLKKFRSQFMGMTPLKNYEVAITMTVLFEVSFE